jgi:hypothetical protein
MKSTGTELNFVQCLLFQLTDILHTYKEKLCDSAIDRNIFTFLTAVGLTPGDSTVVHYTFTHKQYTEYREWNIHNNKSTK